MHDRHRWLFAVCDMAARGADLLQAVGVGVLLDLACVVIRLSGHDGSRIGERR